MSNSRNRKAQVSTEFLMLMGFLFLVFMGLVIILQQQSTSVLASSMQRAQEGIADVFTRELRYAYLAGPGFDRTFNMPRTVLGRNYTVAVLSSSPPAPPASTLVVNLSNTPGATPVVVPLPNKVFTISPAGAFRVRTNQMGDVYFYIPQWATG